MRTFDDGSYIRFNKDTGAFEMYGGDIYKHKTGGNVRSSTKKIFKRS